MSDTQTTTTVSFSVQNAGITTESWVPLCRWNDSDITDPRFLPVEFDSFGEAETFMNVQPTSGYDRYRIVMTTTVTTDLVVATPGAKKVMWS